MLSTVPLRRLAAALLLVMKAAHGSAEGGYDLWLRYRFVGAQWRAGRSNEQRAIVQDQHSLTLDGGFPKNVILQVKNGRVDFPA
ncbi:MAG: hypothetical protein ACJ8F4_10590 [Sphingomonas sp.]